MQKSGVLDWSVALISARQIDRHGLTVAIKLGIKRCLFGLAVDPTDCRVWLDGGLTAPAEFKHQRTIIRGDEKKAIIALASVAAKATRDHHMINCHLRWPEYGFFNHKGYGTSAHLSALRLHGPCPIHRRTFAPIKNIKNQII